jgi:hypothetical protein
MRVVKRDAWTWLLVPALLVAVALVQFRNVIVHDESTWSGAGFGMFATFDNEPTRVVRVTVTIDGADYRAPGSVLGHQAVELRTLPSRDDVQQAAEHLLKQRWRGADGLAVRDETGSAPTAVRVEVVGLRLSGSARHPVVSTMPIRAVELEAEAR